VSLDNLIEWLVVGEITTYKDELAALMDKICNKTTDEDPIYNCFR